MRDEIQSTKQNSVPERWMRKVMRIYKISQLSYIWLRAWNITAIMADAAAFVITAD